MDDKKEKKKRNLFVDDPHMTHQEIADCFGLTRAAIADIERKALAKMKKILNARGYTLEDFFNSKDIKK